LQVTGKIFLEVDFSSSLLL